MGPGIYSHHLADNCDEFLREVSELQVTTSPPALSCGTFGKGATGDESDRTIHFPHGLLEGAGMDLLRTVRIELKNFIAYENEFVFLAEFHQPFLRALV